MRSIGTIGLVILVFGLLASAHGRSEAAQPTSRPDLSDPDVIKWWAHCDLADGQRFITDGGLFIEARYLPNVPVPEKVVPPQGAERLLASKTDHEFALADLDQKDAAGHYVAPGGIHLGHKYIDALRGSPLKANLRMRGKGPNDPVLIVDGEKIVGVMMPIRS